MCVVSLCVSGCDYVCECVNERECVCCECACV